MPGNAPFHADETDLLLGFLDQQRTVLRNAALGLSDEQARSASTASPLSVGGLIKHCALGEQMWMGVVEQRTDAGRDPDAYADSFVMRGDETLAGILALAAEAAAATDALVRGIGDLDHAVPVPQGVPWYPQDFDAWSLRWVVLHLVEEIARHAGHADVIREAIDGATAFPLMAAAEGWPETPWLKPWSPTGS